jgi:hypothetical protein
MSSQGHLLVSFFLHRIQVLNVAHLLLVALNHQRPQILLQFSLINAVFILHVFERYLRFFL